MCATPTPAPSVDIRCDGTQGPCDITYGGTSTISWTSTDATTCTATGDWSGPKATSGSEASSPVTGAQTYNLLCSGPGGSGNDSVSLTVANSAPTASNLRVTEPDYCASSPVAVTSWTYSDPDSDPQSAYEVEVDDTSDFSSPVYDTGKLSSAATSHISGVLSFNTRYYARVRVWDSVDTVSAWATMSLCTGSGCAGDQQSWLTPTHAYPSNVNFTWSPANPSANQEIQFSTDTTTCYTVGGGQVACASYAWDFGDGSAPVAGPETVQVHAYSSTGDYGVEFSATDADGNTCPSGSPLTKFVSVQGNLPEWKEVAPQ